MPLAPFIGVNHHRMSIIFGIAMLRSEDKDAFIWLFQTWVKAMYGQQPRAIITDQDPAMRAAIIDVFPNTVHRCCQWHVMRKARDHLGILYGMKQGFESELKRVINRSMSVSEFEEGWTTMLATYGLQNNKHLKVMFEKRSEWVPAFFRGVFFANMSTTQRSESANSALKLWTNNHSCILEVVKHMEKMINGIWQRESDEDIACLNVVPNLSSLHRIEKDASQCYTTKVLKEFKLHLKNSQLGEITEIQNDTLYEVRISYHPMIDNMIPETYTVNVNKFEELISCSCKGYEFEGLLCSHAIKVMHHVNMVHLPTTYIMKRWCKDANALAKRSKIERSMELGGSEEQQTIRFATLKPRVMKLLKMASKSRGAFTYFQEFLDGAEQQMESMDIDHETQTCEDLACTTDLSKMIFDPPMSQCKGKRKQPQRFKPPSEPRSNAKKPRTCGICGSKKGGHNARTCPERVII